MTAEGASAGGPLPDPAGRTGAGDAVVKVGVLGPTELRVRGRPVAIGGPHRRVVLVLLALERGVAVPVPRLIQAIWGTLPPASANVRVQAHVCGLRKSLTAAGCGEAFSVLETRSPGYQLDARACTTDLDDFLQWRRIADGYADDGRPDRVSEALARALECWRGPALADLVGPELGAQAVRLEELRLVAREDKARADLRLGRYRTVLEELDPVVAAEPLREPTRALLMRALAGLGHLHGALKCYEEGRRLLREDLGIGPGPVLERLAASIRAASGAPVAGAVPRAAT